MRFKTFKVSFRLAFWGGAGLGLLALVVYAFWPKALPVDVEKVTRGELVVEVRAEGRTRVRELYVISAPVAGHLQRIGNRTGLQVDKGDVVAILDPSEAALLDPRSRGEAEAALESASAALRLARAQLSEAEAVKRDAAKASDRAQTLFAKQVVSLSAVDKAATDLSAASARVAAARAAVTRAEADRDGVSMRLDPPGSTGDKSKLKHLRSPAKGRILRVHAQSETVVAAGAPILEIGDPADLEVVAEFLSADAARFKAGASVRLTGWGGDALAGRVRNVEPSAFQKVSALGVEEQRVNVIIDLTEAAGVDALGDAFRVDASVTVWASPDALKVPVSALFRDQGVWAVFRVSNGRVRLTHVEISHQNQHHAEIISGLSADDLVVLYPDRSLADGKPVQPRAN